MRCGAGAIRKVKVGHGGTLDPLATGVLPIALGEATKLAGRLLDSDKVYEFTIRFGEQTETLDAEGAVIAASDVRPDQAAVEAVLPRFTGPIAQVPPAYSALKVDGQRAYDLARAGRRGGAGERGGDDPLPASSPARAGVRSQPGSRTLTIFRRRRPSGTAFGPPQAAETDGGVTLTAHVSKGTYIRSLARDIALALGTVGHVTMLRRTKAGPFDLSGAISLDKLAEAAKARALNITSCR